MRLDKCSKHAAPEPISHTRDMAVPAKI